MGQFDPFDNEFRRRANTIRRTPSPKAWNRLEHRLDRGNRSSTRFLGIRPWMIAALFMLVAGTVGLSTMLGGASSPLAQRSESVEELDNAFAPSDNFDADAFRVRLQESLPVSTDAQAPEFRDLIVNEKYRS